MKPTEKIADRPEDKNVQEFATCWDIGVALLFPFIGFPMGIYYILRYKTRPRGISLLVGSGIILLIGIIGYSITILLST
jgi:hypothetical protein